MSADDASLRQRALEALGPFGDPIAREALETGAAHVEPSVSTWEGSHGTVHAHRVTLVVPAALRARIDASPAAEDALAAAMAAAVAEDPHATLYDLRIEAGTPDSSRAGPYR